MYGDRRLLRSHRTRNLGIVGMVTHLLIDGSNLMHAWPELRALLKRNKLLAREQLVSQLLVLMPETTERVTVVYDGRGVELVVEHPYGPDSVAVIYTPGGLTADDVIEQLVAQSEDASGCLVATGDQAERTTVEAAGAIWCSPAELLARIERAEEQQRGRISKITKKNRGQWTRR